MRRMVTEGSDVYRVVVVHRKQVRNPAYVQGAGQPYWLLLDETWNAEYGPYNEIGSAKAVLTRETVDHQNGGILRWGIVGGWVEKASTTWEKVDLGGDQV